MDDHEDVINLVPVIPETLLSDSLTRTNEIKEDIIFKHRASILIPLISSIKGNCRYFQQTSNLSSIINLAPIDALSIVTPQQVQLISGLIDFVCKNPVPIIRGLEFLLQKQRFNDFLFLCYSALPSVFGFFSTKEHLMSAFSFFCTLVGTSNHLLIKHALLPFYCNCCTFRFVENLIDSFCLNFFHDDRFYETKVKADVMKEYTKPLVSSIIDSFPLLPQTHQFLIKFMKTRGWTNEQVLDFFINDFVINQLLKYMSSTPFKVHYDFFLKYSQKIILNDFLPITQVCFNSNSLYELPSGYYIFDLYFVHILMTTNDVKSILDVLTEAGEAPQCVKQFTNFANLTSTTYEPFWIHFYPKKPNPVDLYLNWRPVVFSQIDLSLYPMEEYEKHLKLSQRDNNIAENDPEKLKMFTKIQKIVDYNNKSQIFETYLVHQMAQLELKHYRDVVYTYYTVINEPLILEILQSNIRDTKNPTPNKIAEFLDQSLQGIDSPPIFQIVFMTIIQWVVPNVIPPERLSILKQFELRWKDHIDQIREQITLPKSFKYKKGNERTALLINRKLWSGIIHLRCLQRVKFEWTLVIVIDSLNLFDELLKLDDKGSSVILYSIVASDCPVLISRFLIINTFIAKQKIFHSMTAENRDIILWYRLENAIFKILSLNRELLNDFLSFQDELIGYQYTNLFCAIDNQI